MEIIINPDIFDIQKISIKKGKTSRKLIYYSHSLFIIGLPFQINDYILVNQSNKYLFIDIDGSKQKDLLYKIDTYFKGVLNMYQSFIEDNILKIKKHKLNHFKKGDNLFISINNIRNKKTTSIIQIFTI